MKIIKAKVRGLGSVLATKWVNFSPHFNLISFPSSLSKSDFFSWLQTINPPYYEKSDFPFANLPQFFFQNQYKKRLLPEKRTAAMAVFSTSPSLVKDLAQISPLLFKVDQVEVGRRLDHTRWINFVELASSSRWSEISQDINTLCKQYGTLPGIETYLPHDRIKRSKKDNLLYWLDKLEKTTDNSHKSLIENLRTKIKRIDFFHSAKDTIKHRLPIFLNITFATRKPAPPDTEILPTLLQLVSLVTDSANTNLLGLVEQKLQELDFPPYPSHLKNILNKSTNNLMKEPPTLIAQFVMTTSLGIAISRAYFETEPIITFDAPHLHYPKATHQELIKHIENIAQQCQCIYGVADGTSRLFTKDYMNTIYVKKDD